MMKETFTLYDNGECDFLEFGIELFENGKRIPVKSERGQKILKMRDVREALDVKAKN